MREIKRVVVQWIVNMMSITVLFFSVVDVNMTKNRREIVLTTPVLRIIKT